MLTNSWLRTGQLYLTHHHIFSPLPTYFARSTFVLPNFGLFRPSFLLPVRLAATLHTHFTAFVNLESRKFPGFDTKLYFTLWQNSSFFPAVSACILNWTIVSDFSYLKEHFFKHSNVLISQKHLFLNTYQVMCDRTIEAARFD